MASPTELSLDCKPKIGSLVSKSYAEHHGTEGTQKLEELVARLEEEKVKINAFKRELPLCLQLLTNAMEASRQELQSQRKKKLFTDKAKWLASATLWNHQLEEEEEESGENEKGGIELGELGLASSSANYKGEIGEVSRREGEKEKRKARRCWSPHLHARFLHALHMLGGSQLATPKQITQLMKVDGLTSDEVKSHLQKYRLHTGIQSPNPVVVVGTIWVPPQYAAHGSGPAAAAFYAATAGRLPLPPPLIGHHILRLRNFAYMTICVSREASVKGEVKFKAHNASISRPIMGQL